MTTNITHIRKLSRQLLEAYELCGSHRNYDLIKIIDEQEKAHRRGRPRMKQSKAVARDYFVVRCFAFAFCKVYGSEFIAPGVSDPELPWSPDMTVEDVHRSMSVRLDYLLALSIVATHQERFKQEVNRVITGCGDWLNFVSEVIGASEEVDYTRDIVGGEA